MRKREREIERGERGERTREVSRYWRHNDAVCVSWHFSSLDARAESPARRISRAVAGSSTYEYVCLVYIHVCFGEIYNKIFLFSIAISIYIYI